MIQYDTTWWDGYYYKGVCPDGWRLPLGEDWNVLIMYCGGWFIAGGAMKSTGNTGNTYWISPNTGATNSSGFTALPGGGIGWDGGSIASAEMEHSSFRFKGSNYPSTIYFLWYNSVEVMSRSSIPEDGVSVRCFKPCGTPTQANAGPDQLEIVGTSATMQGNTPAEGTGRWIIISGEGGNFADPLNPTSDFIGVSGPSYILSWTIANSCGDESLDTVQISFAPFICGTSLTDSRDGQIYNTLQIGTQCWMGQNLNIGTMIDGGIAQTDNDIIEKYCYNNISDSCTTYGGLYQFDEMMQYVTTPGVQGICPGGWHVPDNTEYTTLVNYLGGSAVAGGKMKEGGTLHWSPPNTGATNESGFTALPGGIVLDDGSFSDLTLFGYYNTSSELDTDNSWVWYLYTGSTAVNTFSIGKDFGLSVRCIKDN